MDRDELLRRYAAGETDFRKADLSGIDLSQARFAWIDLSYADLSGANLSGVYLQNSHLDRANLSEANLTEANLTEAKLWRANLSRANLRKANLSGVFLVEANLSRANFKEANLSEVYLTGANLRKANLSAANLSRAKLKTADLTGTNLKGTNLSGTNLSTFDLSGFNLSRANLTRTNLRKANLSAANLSRAKLKTADLTGTNLKRTNLSGTNLSIFDLSGFNLSRANLSGCYLITSKFLNANLNEAILTGACIEDWHINSQTDLTGVVCEYIYLRYNPSATDPEKRFTERRPHDPNKNFAPGEFTKLFRKARETVDLIFSNGIDWNAFLASFQGLQIECEGGELSIQAIEKKSSGSFVVRVEVPANADKAAIETKFEQRYRTELQKLEATYQLKLQIKDTEIEGYQRENTRLDRIVRFLADRPITVEAKAVAESQPKSVEVEMNANEGSQVTSMVGKNSGGIHHYAPEQKKSLAEAAAEIQQLLEQLEQTYPTQTLVEQATFAEKAIERIKSNASLKERVIGVVQAMSVEALMELVNHPVANVLRAGVEKWLEPGSTES